MSQYRGYNVSRKRIWCPPVALDYTKFCEKSFSWFTNLKKYTPHTQPGDFICESGIKTHACSPNAAGRFYRKTFSFL